MLSSGSETSEWDLVSESSPHEWGVPEQPFDFQGGFPFPSGAADDGHGELPPVYEEALPMDSLPSAQLYEGTIVGDDVDMTEFDDIPGDTVQEAMAPFRLDINPSHAPALHHQDLYSPSVDFESMSLGHIATVLGSVPEEEDLSAIAPGSPMGISPNHENLMSE